MGDDDDDDDDNDDDDDGDDDDDDDDVKAGDKKEKIEPRIGHYRTTIIKIKMIIIIIFVQTCNIGVGRIALELVLLTIRTAENDKACENYKQSNCHRKIKLRE